MQTIAPQRTTTARISKLEILGCYDQPRAKIQTKFERIMAEQKLFSFRKKISQLETLNEKNPLICFVINDPEIV